MEQGLFQVVTLLFVVTNGVPANEPNAQMRNPRHFETMEACQEYLESDAGKALQAVITNTKTITSHQAEVKFECVKTGDPL